MQCAICQSEIPEGAKNCPQCGNPLDTSSFPISNNTVIKAKKPWLNWDLLNNILVILIVLTIFLAIAIPNFLAAQLRNKISQVKADLQNIATAMESYYIDNMVYPRVDFDENGKPIVPYTLTTPVFYLKTLPHDPFKNHGRGYYEFAGGPIGPGGIQNTWISSGYIITSYGPDEVDGNSGVQPGSYLREEIAWTDRIFMGFFPYPLQASGLTYDPTNGLHSPGDIWRRGP